MEPETDGATLTTKQRAHLRSLAHRLRPLMHVGKEGITEQSVRSLAEAFNSRELIKIKVLEAAPLDAGEAGELLARGVEGARLVQVIGRTLVLYRRHPTKPEIKLPARGAAG